MKLNYMDKIVIDVDPNKGFSILAGEQSWETKDGFVPVVVLYDMQDKQEKTFMFSDAFDIEQEEYKTGYSRGIRTYYKGFSFDADFSFATYVEIIECTGQVKIGIIPINDTIDYLRKIIWPGPFDFTDIREDYYTVYPLQQGILIPNGWKKDICLHDRWELRAEMLYSRSGYMPWFGQVRGKEGYWYLVNTPFDAGFTLEHQAYGDCSVGTVWHSQLGKIAYKRESTYTFYDDCDYNTFCRAFRQYLKESGELCTLKEKMIKNPSVQTLIGTSIYHDIVYRHVQPESFYYDKEHPENNDSVVTFEEMADKLCKIKERGINKVFVHLDGWTRCGYDNQHPDTLPPCEAAGGWDGFRKLSETVKSLGYQFAIHDQYRDFFLNAPSYDPEYSKKNIDGTVDCCEIWNGGKQEYLCPEFYLGYVKRNFTAIKEHDVFLDGAYIDVFSCEPLDECSGRLHRVTREQCMKERKKCLDYVRAQGIIISSEEGVCWAMRDLDLIHHAPYVFESVPDPAKLCGRMLPETIGVPVPLLNLVYHDCVVTPWSITAKINGQSGFLHALLNGGVAYTSLKLSEEENEQVKRVASWHELVGTSEMIKHEILDKSGDVQRTVFANGAEITVDFGKNTYDIKKAE